LVRDISTPFSGISLEVDINLFPCRISHISTTLRLGAYISNKGVCRLFTVSHAICASLYPLNMRNIDTEGTSRTIILPRESQQAAHLLLQK
jgi:hypothetical protein